MFILQLFAAISLSFGADVVVQSEGASKVSFNSYLETHSDKKSYIEHYRFKNGLNSKQMGENLKRAQFNYLEGSLDKAKKLFQQIARKRFKNDWKPAQRKVINYALFRLAQMEQNPSKKDAFLLQAIHFDFKLAPDESLFPPPLIEKYRELKSKTKTKTYSLPKNTRKFDQVLINGRLLSSHSTFFKSTSGEKRFTFLSNIYAPVTMTISPSKLADFKLKAKPIASGDCRNPRFNQVFKNQPIYVFYKGNCLVPAKANMRSMVNEATLPSINNRISIEEKPSFYKRNKYWIWAGAAIVAGFATYKVIDSNRQSPPPTIQPNSGPITESQN